MGCGASSSKVSSLQDDKIIDPSTLDKPVQGVSASDVVQGTPVAASVSQRTAAIVNGLAKAAGATMATHPICAAGLAASAVSIADSLPVPSDVNVTPEMDSVVAAGLAHTALESAKAASP